LELVPFISDAARLLVLDAVNAGVTPGTVFRIAGQDLCTLRGNGSVHELALADILNALRMMGREPNETVLLGVQPSATELGTALSTPVRQALPTLVETALSELSRWTTSEECSIGRVHEEVEEGVAISVPID
jgi:hydrogenase maturation protease